MTRVRTRFAPSPTGSLHIGGARTAFLSMLYAKKHGGDFILRIEDTDQARNSTESLLGILEDLAWLGIDYVEGPAIDAVRKGEPLGFGPNGPYYQSQRLDIYNTYLDKLLAAGQAYYAWDTPEELEAMRKIANPGDPYGYVRPDNPVRTMEEAERAAGGRPIVVRFQAPASKTIVEDLVLGTTEFPPGHVNDFIIRKSDGMPTYHFAVVVDDFLMGITHVIRAQEHYSNTPKHVALQLSLGFNVPKYAHLPLVFNAQGKKMSKREKDKVVKRFAKKWLEDKGAGNSLSSLVAAIRPAVTGEAAGLDLEALVTAWYKDPDMVIPQGAIREAIADVVKVPAADRPEIDVADFKKAGFFADAILNYIALLGWSPGTGQEIFTREELVQAFDLEKVSKTNARFDRKKLVSFNLTHCNNAMSGTPEQRAGQREAFKEYLEAVGDTRLLALGDDKLDILLEAKKGWRLYSDVASVARPLFTPLEEIEYSPAACEKEAMGPGQPGRELLARVGEVLAAQGEWTQEALEKRVHGWCEEQGLAIKDVAPKIRIALTGTTVSPALWPTLVLVGREETLRRIEVFLANK